MLEFRKCCNELNIYVSERPVEDVKKGYIIRPGKAYGMDNYIRVSTGTFEQMKGFMNSLIDII